MSPNSTALPIPSAMPTHILGKMRVVDLKDVVNYARGLPKFKLKLQSPTLKVQHISTLISVLSYLFSEKNKKSYEAVVGYMVRSYGNLIGNYTHYTWNARKCYPIPTSGPRTSLPTNTTRFSRNIVQVGVPAAVPGGMVNAQFLKSPAYNSNTTYSRNSHMNSAGSAASARGGLQNTSNFNNVKYSESSFVSPRTRIANTVICSDTRSISNTVRINFRLTPEQIDLISIIKDDSNKPQYEIHLYMCQYSAACSYLRAPTEQGVVPDMPASYTLVTNSKMVRAEPLKSVIAKKSGVDITSYIHRSTDIDNIVQISYTTHLRWIATVYLVKRHTALSILHEIRKTSFVDAATVRNAFFKGSDDDDLISVGAVISLKCPLGLSRITTPIRSKYCAHTQCFDGETFLKMNEQSPTWKCPICSITIKSWRELLIDGYFEEILTGTKDNDTDQVHVSPDGEWRLKESDLAVDLEDQATTSESVDKVSQNGTSGTIDLSDSSTSAHNTSTGSDAHRRKRVRLDVVDLTIDSDDESDNDTYNKARHSATTPVSDRALQDPVAPPSAPPALSRQAGQRSKGQEARLSLIRDPQRNSLPSNATIQAIAALRPIQPYSESNIGRISFQQNKRNRRRPSRSRWRPTLSHKGNVSVQPVTPASGNTDNTSMAPVQTPSNTNAASAVAVTTYNNNTTIVHSEIPPGAALNVPDLYTTGAASSIGATTHPLVGSTGDSAWPPIPIQVMSLIHARTTPVPGSTPETALQNTPQNTPQSLPVSAASISAGAEVTTTELNFSTTVQNPNITASIAPATSISGTTQPPNHSLATGSGSAASTVSAMTSLPACLPNDQLNTTPSYPQIQPRLTASEMTVPRTERTPSLSWSNGSRNSTNISINNSRSPSELLRSATSIGLQSNTFTTTPSPHKTIDMTLGDPSYTDPVPLKSSRFIARRQNTYQDGTNTLADAQTATLLAKSRRPGGSMSLDAGKDYVDTIEQLETAAAIAAAEAEEDGW